MQEGSNASLLLCACVRVFHKKDSQKDFQKDSQKDSQSDSQKDSQEDSRQDSQEDSRKDAQNDQNPYKSLPISHKSNKNHWLYCILSEKNV